MFASSGKFIVASIPKFLTANSFTIVAICKDAEEMSQVAASLDGQLTATIMGTEEELTNSRFLIDRLTEKVGRLIFNGVPTGVEVCNAMHHGGPYPASSNGIYTSVGTGAIRRFARPVCYQNAVDAILPAALKRDNPLEIWRKVNGKMVK